MKSGSSVTTIRAAWRRTIQVRPYESETLELAIEDEIPDRRTQRDILQAVEQLSRDLSSLGDRLIVDRLEHHGSAV